MSGHRGAALNRHWEPRAAGATENATATAPGMTPNPARTAGLPVVGLTGACNAVWDRTGLLRTQSGTEDPADPAELKITFDTDPTDIGRGAVAGVRSALLAMIIDRILPSWRARAAVDRSDKIFSNDLVQIRKGGQKSGSEPWRNHG